MIAAPSVERLMRRVAETPAEFVTEPSIREAAGVATAALVADLLRDLGHEASAAELAAFQGSQASDRNRLKLVAVAVWLLAEGWVAAAAPERFDLLALLDRRVGALAEAGTAEIFVADADRREELVRTALAALGQVPEGETPSQAADRLSAVSATERRRLLHASRKAEERAREIREALIRKAAEEAADKYTRE